MARSFPGTVDGTPDKTKFERQQEQRMKEAEAANDDRKKSRLETLLEKDEAEILKICEREIENLTACNDKSAIVQADRNKAKTVLDSIGISRKAQNIAIAISKLSDDELPSLDLAVFILRKALKKPTTLPYQVDMFEEMRKQHLEQ